MLRLARLPTNILCPITQGVSWIVSRDLSGQAGGRRNNVKTALHSLYKLVHPDLFSHFPSEKAENERSLKLLQEYISRSESVDGRSVAYSTSYSFVFYLKTNEQIEPRQQGTHYQPHVGPQLKKVALTLPPPAPSLAEGHLSLTGRKGLSRLLQVCGLPELEIFDGSGAALSSRLLPFLTDAVEEARIKQRDSVQSEVRIANVRGAMRYARKVLVMVDNKQLDPLVQIRLLEDLARVLDTLPGLDLSGCRITLADRTGISPSGQLLLDTTESAEDWTYFLEEVDLDYCRQLLQRVQDVKQLEQMVAQSIGVGMIYTTPSSQLYADYRIFLERLSAHALSHGPVQAGKLSKLPVMVNPATHTPASPISDTSAEDHVDKELGYLRLSVLCDAETAYSIIQAHGAMAVSLLERKEAESNFENTMTDTARKVLRLRRLKRDNAVTHQQYVAACKHLMQHRMELVDLLDGQCVQVATGNRVAPDGSFIDVAWDFEL